MLMLLAALIQATPAPALTPDPVQAALTCREALVTGLATLSFETAAQFSYFSMQAARALPGNEDYFQRMNAVQTSVSPGVSRENAGPLREACDRRFPLARRTDPVALPGAVWERDLMCAGVTTVLMGTARAHGERTGDTAPYDRLRAIALRFQPRVAAGMAEHGVNPETLRRVIGDQIFASLDIGNAWAIAMACEARETGG